jgi:hypothetical protein
MFNDINQVAETLRRGLLKSFKSIEVSKKPDYKKAMALSRASASVLKTYQVQIAKAKLDQSNTKPAKTTRK